MSELPPGLVLVLGALLVPLVPARLRPPYMLLLPLLSLVHLLTLEPGIYGRMTFLGYELLPVRVDPLALVFGYVFHLAAFLSALYALHLRDNVQHVAGLAYAGSAIGGVFAGDLITLFVYWELTAITSVFLVWARRSERAYRVGLRYLVIQVGSGVLLLAGLLLHYQHTGSLAFDYLGIDHPGGLLIFLAFGIKCAFPLLHNWLQDAYPEATITGTVFLSAFTTKMAVYALARGFPGTEILVPIGAAMTVFPIFYAVIENDLRRVLAYSLNNQLGFMVVGVGVGTEMALNGTVSHAFAHILYKALLFMSMGAILHRAGTIKASELGALYKSMPLSACFCLVGAAAISAFPLFSGFVTKSLTLTAAANEGYAMTWYVLLFASAGVLHHSGIKIPFCGFFGPDRGLRCQEAPANMLAAMGLTAFLCVAIGVYPQPLYALLPYPVDFEPYTTSHVVTQLQLLLCALLAFALLERRHLEPPNVAATNLDFDWTYRRLLPALSRTALGAGRSARAALAGQLRAAGSWIFAHIHFYHGPGGFFARTWLTGSATLVVTLLLAAYLFFYFQF